MRQNIHKYDNGIKVFEHHLIDAQKERYGIHNVHEAEEEPVFLDVLKKLDRNAVYVNVGAAVGYYPLLVKLNRDDVKIVAYEPLKLHRKYFYENVKLNGFKKSDFKLHSEGVYKTNGVTGFSISHYGSMIAEDNSAKNIFQQLAEVIANKRIKTITLEKLYKRVGSEIGLLQMDIQGLELDVIESSEAFIKKHHISRFLIGTHSEEIHQRCKRTLSKCGYVITVDMYNTKLQPDGILLAELPKNS